tara:strand:+ start:223 stop:555 length:333 start_codon:yes stop_codon:yes gene_type:complete
MTDPLFFTAPDVVKLLGLFRSNTGSGHVLALQCLLLCAEEPRTIEELCNLTGSRNGNVNVAVRTLTPWWDKKTEAVIQPELHLLQRRKIPNSRAHRVHLTRRGRALLQPH